MEWLNLHQLLLAIQRSVSFAGIMIIVIGVLIALSQFVHYFFNKKAKPTALNGIRLNLGRIFILGLEFIVAADLISTTTTPDYYSLGILAIIVLIRTVLSFTLNKEIMGLSKEEAKLQ
jgi:uncharacterized membrane protein